MNDVSKLSPRQLFELHSEIERELCKREIIRTANKPTGDLAEHLFCKAFRWNREDNSKEGYDATGRKGSRYQIKGRRITHNKSRQMSAIRGLEKKRFDFLAGLLFNEDYSVFRAALIPYKVVLKLVRPDEHVNGHRLLLLNDIWEIPEVKDVTDKLRAVWR